jgi:hypothetical protein
MKMRVLLASLVGTAAFASFASRRTHNAVASTTHVHHHETTIQKINILPFSKGQKFVPICFSESSPSARRRQLALTREEIQRTGESCVAFTCLETSVSD